MKLDLTILIDTREQNPLQFPGFSTESCTLLTGDYSARADGVDLREVVTIERKSLSDLLGCVGHSRERFERELARLQRYPFKALVIEAAMSEVAAGTRWSKLTPKQVMSSVLSWNFKYGVPTIFCCNRDYASAVTRTLLFHAARYAKENGDADLSKVRATGRRVPQGVDQ